MFGNDELLAIGTTLILSASALGAVLLRRRRAALVLAVVAGIATIATLVLLRAGIGHRA